MAGPQTQRRDMWAVLVIDPVALPLGRAVARLPGVTPNRVTGLAALAGLASATCFATGQLRVGGVLFLLRYLFDVMDGAVARAQSSSSARGAALDVAADVAGIGLCFGALSWYLIRVGHVPTAVPLLLLSTVVFYNWVLAYRKGLAAGLDLGDGGLGGNIRGDVPLVGGWLRLSERLNMRPHPWAVEVETVALGLCPLVLPTEHVWVGLAVALGFYIVADLVNLRRILGLADTAQARKQELTS